MTFLSRKKRPTTAPRTRAVPRALSLACLLGAVAAGSAVAQQPGRATHPPPPTSLQTPRTAPPQAARPAAGKVMHFQKPADGVAPVSADDRAVPPAMPMLSAGTGLPELPLPTAAAAQPKALPNGQKGDQKDKAMSVPTAEQIAKYTKLETRERIFSIPNDATLEKYIRTRTLEENPDLKASDLLAFPPIPDVGEGKSYVAKTAAYPPMRAEYYSLYVVHRRLHFEDKNAERYGWDLGIIQPAVSAVLFYKDVFLWPQSLASGCAYGFWDTSAGKCLPGSPTPYMLYPPGLTITGSVVEGAIVTGLSFAIP